jgi:hypothetical protein
MESIGFGNQFSRFRPLRHLYPELSRQQF